jgi:hypothetical protein
MHWKDFMLEQVKAVMIVLPRPDSDFIPSGPPGWIKHPGGVGFPNWTNIVDPQVRRGQKSNGEWNVIVDRAGSYEFELRRWPREADAPISSQCTWAYRFASKTRWLQRTLAPGCGEKGRRIWRIDRAPTQKPSEMLGLRGCFSSRGGTRTRTFLDGTQDFKSCECMPLTHHCLKSCVVTKTSRCSQWGSNKCLSKRRVLNLHPGLECGEYARMFVQNVVTICRAKGQGDLVGVHPVAPDVVVAEVIGEDDDDIRFGVDIRSG